MVDAIVGGKMRREMMQRKRGIKWKPWWCSIPIAESREERERERQREGEK